MDPTPIGAGWSARLALEVEQVNGRSGIARRRHHGPLYVQRAFYPEGPTVPHIYVLHPPGGVVGGDQLELEVRVQPSADALITTPAAQKLYRSSGATSVQRTRLIVQDDAALEWFPSESIAFDATRAKLRTELVLAESAAAIAWDILCFGRPASALPFRSGELGVDFEIERGGRPLLIERTRVEGGSPLLEAAWGYRGLPVFGTLYCVPRVPQGLDGLVDTLRLELASLPSSAEHFALSALEEVLVLRVSGTSVERVRALLSAAWGHLRPKVLGRAAVPPRIWNV